MFNFSSSKARNPSLYTGASIKKRSNSDIQTPISRHAASDSLERAIDGPPSPERIRAYTEQMKKNSLLGINLGLSNRSRTNTISSVTSSTSRDSTFTGPDNVSFSRKSSLRSDASSMPPVEPERPESAHGGSIFSRSGRRRRATHADSLRSHNSSLTLGEASKGGVYYGNGAERRRKMISEPYNFRHITHTRQEHLPDLQRSSGTELVSEFSAIQESQATTHGELKGIRAQNLHFENFSSEALPYLEPISRASSNSPRQKQRTLSRKRTSPMHQRTLAISQSKSYDSLSSTFVTPLGAPPPRPPRSLASPDCPLELPERTSSRMASDRTNSVASSMVANFERPIISGVVSRSAPFDLPTPSSGSFQETTQEYFSYRPVSNTLSTTSADACWPLATASSITYGVELADVQEEDEDAAKVKSSLSLSDLGVDPTQEEQVEQGRDRLDARLSTTLGHPRHRTIIPQAQRPISLGFGNLDESWEQDIEWCYEHEAEADCEFQWLQLEEALEQIIPSSTYSPALELRVQDDERVYHGSFRPSMIVPSSLDPPELSPMSNASSNATSSDPQTPVTFLRPQQLRNLSQASSFKECHGFTLSPTLLIPSDFQSQMDHDAHSEDTAIDTTFTQAPYNPSVLSFDESASRTASYRSSNFSRGSARSSSSTRMSDYSRESHDLAGFLHSRAASISKAECNFGSPISLPDLIPSGRAPPATDLSAKLAALQLKFESPTPNQPVLHRKDNSVHFDQSARAGLLPSTLPHLTIPKVDTFGTNSSLSPVAEMIPTPGFKEHGRKISAPVSPSVRDFKSRSRAMTGPTLKKRSSYSLFPQV